MSSEPAITVDHASKKFTRSLRRTMLYGMTDIAGDLMGMSGSEATLRKDEFWAVDDSSFTVAPGECVALLGPNGAGKSTMLKMLNGIILPNKGRIAMRGRVGALIEVGAGFHPLLTGRENVYVNGAILGLTKKEVDARFDSIVDFAELGEFIDSPVKMYSSGMYVRLGFAVAAHVDPDILLIDEVLAVGDVGFRMKCFKHLLSLLDNGTSIVLVSHAVNQLSRVTNRAVVYSQGQTVFDGDLPEGIAVYQQGMAPLETDTETRGDHETRLGDMLVHGGDGIKRTDFQTEEDIYVDIPIHAEKPRPNCRLIVAVSSPASGNLGTISTPYTGFQFDVDSPQTVIRLCLPNTPLLVGGYQLNISLFGPDIEDFYDRKMPAAAFSIVGPPTNAFGFGIGDTIKFEHTWEQIAPSQQDDDE
jgi:homopolymeric O-antigen transport system ATP-binding protein